MIAKTSTMRRLKNTIFIVLCWVAVVISYVVLFDVLYELLVRGVSSLGSYIFSHDTREFGLRNAIVGSLILTFGSVLVAAPLAILTATFFVEYKQFKRTIKVLRFLNDIMLSTPSVIIGLVVYTLIVVYTGFSAYAGIIALSLIAMPMVTRASEGVLCIYYNITLNIFRLYMVCFNFVKWS